LALLVAAGDQEDIWWKTEGLPDRDLRAENVSLAQVHAVRPGVQTVRRGQKPALGCREAKN
jgi:hypothetical protein